jgi:hypothetical protein
MKQEPETELSATRRRVLQAVGGIGAGTLGLGGDGTGQLPEPPPSISHEKNKFHETKTHPMAEKVGYLTLPGVSLTSLIPNIPNIVTKERESPVIIMDSHDYARFKGRVITERKNIKVQHLAMVYDELDRRDILKTIDYAAYYSPDRQEHNLRQVRRALASLSEYEHRQAVEEAAKGYLHYGLGEHQQPMRANFNDSAAFAEHRQEVQHQYQQIDRGVGDPRLWNEEVVSQYMAAVEVWRRANADLDLNIKHIIGQGESSSIAILLDAAPDLDWTSDTQLENPLNPITEINLDKTSQVREILDEMSAMAKETARVQHHDWFVIGSRLALPAYEEMFDGAWSDMRFDRDTKDIVAETRDLLTYLDKEAADGPSEDHLRDKADWIIEKHEEILSPEKKQQLLTEFRDLVDLQNHSRDLRSLEGRYTPPAIYLAATVKMDPVYNYNNDELYQLAADMQNRLGPQTVTDPQIERFMGRGSFRREAEASRADGDWYQIINRPKVAGHGPSPTIIPK